MKISLTGSDTQSRSVLASAQRRLNMYAELTDPNQGEPGQITHYPTPGLTLLGSTPNGQPIRGLYRATNGDLYAMANLDLYYIDPNWIFHPVGTIPFAPLNPVKMADNGTSIILCDGSTTTGYAINMSTRSNLAKLLDPTKSDEFTPSSTGWLGSTYVDFTDTFFVANSPGTPTFYLSNSEDIIFDPLQFAGKSGNADILVAAIVQHRVIWLIGTLSTEIWYNTGGDTTATGTFPFAIMPAIAIDWGCAATYSIAKAETSIFWLAQNLNGSPVVLMGSGLAVKRISTHAIENIFSQYARIDDARAYTYMQEGHSFYVLNFPSADATWVFDIAMQQWHQRAWLDSAGIEHRQRPDCHAFAYGKNVVNDWQNGNLYALDLNNGTDNGQPIKRVISVPRQVDPANDHRVIYKSLTVEMDVGESTDPADIPLLTLRWSDDKSKTWSNGMAQAFGTEGQFGRTIKFNRLGMARNRTFELAWASNCFTAVQSVYVDVEIAGS